MHMLGINRKVWTDEKGVRHMDMNQKFYIEELYDRFKDQVPSKIPTTPFPPNKWLDRSLGGRDQDEFTRNIDKDYMGLTGGLLWAARHTCLECQFGVNQLCSVMSTPPDLAMQHGLYVLSWMYHNR